MTTLCLDFGNTRLKAAIFHHSQIVQSFTLPDDSIDTLQQIIDTHQPQRSILSSVMLHNTAIEDLLASKTLFHKLSHQSVINFTTPVGKPSSIGADRLALCAAAVRFYPGQNNLIIALGSCITYNFLNQYHQFLGGAISPGMQMRFKSMNEYTAQLPLVKPDEGDFFWQYPILGYDTRTNLQSGVLAGISYEIAGFIEFYAKRYGNFNVVLTGGDAHHFARELKSSIFADLNFLFKGLYALSEINNCNT
jgi:type III pantothenate kinase